MTTSKPKKARFTLRPGRWYALEMLRDDASMCGPSRHYSPIQVHKLRPKGQGDSTMELEFFHANYPDGVQGKDYKLKVLERASGFLLAKSLVHSPVRYLLIHELDPKWMRAHFGLELPDGKSFQDWLEEVTKGY